MKACKECLWCRVKWATHDTDKAKYFCVHPTVATAIGYDYYTGETTRNEVTIKEARKGQCGFGAKLFQQVTPPSKD